VRYLTEQHGGTVKVESAGEGQGATFTIRLPLHPLSSGMAQAQLPSTQTFDLENLKILLVDDEADMRDLVLTVLERQNAQVKVTASAPEALVILEQWHPDLLISDIGMPETDGYMLMRQIRSLPPDRCGRIPAIALTAYAGETDQQQAHSAGFQQHLAKPVEPEKLIEAISNLLVQSTVFPI
jgi:CheY-like chemotaxis protein